VLRTASTADTAHLHTTLNCYASVGSIEVSMYDATEVEAARWRIFCLTVGHRSIPYRKLSVPSPEEWYYVAILRASTNLYQCARQLTVSAAEEYDRDLRIREEAVGRVIDHSIPVRFSNSLTNVAYLIQQGEDLLPKYSNRIDELADLAPFESDTVYQDAALAAINTKDNLHNMAMLNLHTHLWGIWVNESLSQASQVYEQMTNQDRLGQESSSIYPYVAHPPLMVATLGSTAMIEEVGTYYINKFTDRHVNTDNTSCTKILDELSETYSGYSEFDTSSIREAVIDARNVYSHYLLKRADPISGENLYDYIECCQESVRLSGILARTMAYETFKDYRERVLDPV